VRCAGSCGAALQASSAPLLSLQIQPTTLLYTPLYRLTAEEGQANDVRVALGPGAVIKGRVLDRDGMPVKKTLHFKAAPYTRAQDPSDGRFTLFGIPPNRELQFARVDKELVAGTAGSETSV